MLVVLIVIFVATYAAIVLEHPLGINKSASTLIGGGLLWTLYALFMNDPLAVGGQLDESLAATAKIVFFLIGAMTIVEVIDAHNGFEVITRHIWAARQGTLIVLVGIMTFFLSAILDNLTTTIVMLSLTRKLLAGPEDRIYFAGIIVIAANAGGAWTPIGDVTTTMLWIGGQITALSIIKSVFLPSLVSLIVPLSVVAHTLRDRQVSPLGEIDEDHGLHTTPFERKLMFFLGLGILVAVPAFKTLTNLPPYLGILFGLGILWLVGDLVHREKEDEDKRHLTLGHALSRIDMSSVVFFIGILLAVATLEHTHILSGLAAWLGQVIGREEVMVLAIGLVSAVVDNVPLVAAAMGMYDLTLYPPGHFFWEFLAYCAGTGGSILIVGSASGVAAMGLEKINFFWYLRKISGFALLGYFAGAGIYLLQHKLFQ